MLFRDCLNLYGWHKRAENEMKDWYGKSDYEYKVREKLETYDPMK